MRICLVTGQFATPYSGVGTYARALATGMRAEGAEVRVACPGEQVDLALGFEFMPVSVRRVPGHARWVAHAWSFGRSLKGAGNADVVHFVDAREGLWYAGSAPAVGTIHDYYFVDPVHFWRRRACYPDWRVRLAYAAVTRHLERRAYRTLCALIANSDCTRTRVASAYRLPNPVTTIHIGLPLQIVERDDDQRSDSVLFVGGNPSRKGLDRLIRCLPLLPPPVELWIAGSTVPPAHEALARRLGVWSRVRQLGMVHGEALRSLYRQAKVLALPGITEAFGLVFMEAMASRCAVIGPTDGGAGELVEDGVTGYLVPYDDDDLLARRLTTLMTEHTVRCTMTDRAARALSRFSVETMAARTLHVYRTLLSPASGERKPKSR